VAADTALIHGHFSLCWRKQPEHRNSSLLDRTISLAKSIAARAIPYALPDLLLTPDGGHMVTELGHRRYVGGNWDRVSEGTMAFLVSQGLRPEHVLLDIACGSTKKPI
jgi:hypothetical protein